MILRVLKPLGDRILDDGLHFQTVLLAVAVQELLELLVDTICDRDHSSEENRRM
jgi:hypothetical protein